MIGWPVAEAAVKRTGHRLRLIVRTADGQVHRCADVATALERLAESRGVAEVRLVEVAR